MSKLRSLAVGTLTAGILAAGTGVASAAPVSPADRFHHPDLVQTEPYCGPGMVYVAGYGCARTDLPPDTPTDSGGLFAAVVSAVLPAFLIF